MYLCYYSINLILQFLSLAFSIAVIITLYPTGKYCPLDVPKTLPSVVPRTSSKYTIWPSQGRPHLISWGPFFVEFLRTSLERSSKDVIRMMGRQRVTCPYIILWYRPQVRKLRRRNDCNAIAKNCFLSAWCWFTF